jgi:hypothetical protein
LIVFDSEAETVNDVSSKAGSKCDAKSQKCEMARVKDLEIWKETVEYGVIRLRQKMSRLDGHYKHEQWNADGASLGSRWDGVCHPLHGDSSILCWSFQSVELLPTLRKIMRFLLLFSLLFCLPAFADLAPMRESSYSDNNAEDSKTGPILRADELCMDKKQGDSCLIPGSHWEGGGKGSCARNGASLSCFPSNIVWMDRQVPCNRKVSGNRDLRCEPTAEIPADRFCTGKAVGNACTLEMGYGNTIEKIEGVCKADQDVVGMAHPNDPILRNIIICALPQGEPKNYVPEFKQVPLWKRVLR